jgi:2-polyprenyl-3-methyl-5-hydroxy-6-metoxy-1,4-benzoquinol methylase
MNKELLQANLKRPESRAQIVREFCRGKVVLDIGCVQHDIENADTSTWLHKQIVDVAAEVLGVDYLDDAIAVLKQRGYNVRRGDVNGPLDIDGQFDTIVVGNLIEHLSNFEGLLNNLNRLLKPDGHVLISTCNPFYVEQYFYSAFNNNIIVNPEHTCWLDPITLDQLSKRFGLSTSEVRWVKEGWALSSGVIFDGNGYRLDIFTGRWTFDPNISIQERIIAPVLSGILDTLRCVTNRGGRIKQLYGSESGRFLYLLLKGSLFGIYWKFRRLLIPQSDINRFEVFVSVLRKLP